MNRFFPLILIAGLSVMAFYIPVSDAMRAVWSLEQMIQRSDVIVVGTVENTWIDFRPFNEYMVVDTAKIRVDEWLKNEIDSDTLDIRYYGRWAKTIDELRGRHISDTPVHKYESGQRVLVLVSHENPTMVMGTGYYPFYEGGFTIKDDVAVSQDGKEMELSHLYDVIKNHYKSDKTTNSLSQSSFETIKSKIEETGYDICNIRLLDDTIIIDLNKIFEGTKQEKQIISQISPNTDYDIVYHDGYTDYFINTMTGHSCE